jgi:N4-gp56 family major capsid protein
MAVTTYGAVAPSKTTQVYFEREALKFAEPVIVLGKFGATKSMPQNKGQSVEFRRPRTFTAATTPLMEGVTPSARTFSYDTVSVSLRQYGDLVEITDHIADTHMDPVLNEAAQQSGQNIGRTIEQLTYGVVKAGTQVLYANGTARTDVNTAIALGDLRAAVRALEAQKAQRITRILSASPDYGTSAVEAGFVAICHTDLANDIRGIAGFVPAAQYGSRSLLHPRELGSVEDIRFITSPDLAPWADAGGAKGSMLSTSGTSADVYPVLVLGQDAFGTVAIKGLGAVEPSIIPVGTKSGADPLGQRGYVGWKTWFAAKVLNENWMARIECAATAL